MGSKSVTGDYGVQGASRIEPDRLRGVKVCSHPIRLTLCLLLFSLLAAIFPLPARASDDVTVRPALARSGPQPFVTILCKFADVPAEPEAAAFFERLLSAEEPGLDHYWRAVSYGAISLEGSSVSGWHTLPAARDFYLTAGSGVPDLDRLAQDCADAAGGGRGGAGSGEAMEGAGVEWARYVGMIFVFNADLARPAGGTTCLALDQSSRRTTPDAAPDARRCYPAAWIWPNYYHNQALWAHEIGHALGLRHSATNDLGQASSEPSPNEYGNPWDVMSDCGPCGPDARYGQVAQEPAAYHKDLLGWIPPARKITVPLGATQRITLTQLAEPGPEGYLLAEIPLDDSGLHFYTVEARRQAGYDRHLPGDAVVIHTVSLETEVTAWAKGMDNNPAGMWTPGNAFVDTRRNIVVMVDAATESGFIVTILTRPYPWVLSPGHGQLLSAGPVQFAWQPIAEATAYDLGIIPTSGSWPARRIVRRVDGTTRTVDLPPGGYIWEVRAVAGETEGEWVVAGFITTALLPSGDMEVSYPADTAGAPGARSVPPDARILPDGKGGAYAVWRANLTSPFGGQDSGSNVYAAYRPAGETWGPAEQINEGPSAHRSDPILGVDGAGHAYAAWIDDRTGAAAVYFSVRTPAAGTEGGESRWSTNVKVTDNAGTAGGAAMHTGLVLAVDRQGNAHAAWSDNRDGQAHIYTAFRPADGPWTANVRADRGEGRGSTPSLAVDGAGNAYLAWVERRGCAAGRWASSELLFAARPASGDGSWSAPARIAVNPGMVQISAPVIVADTAANLYAAWQEGSGPGAIIYGTSCPQGCGGAIQPGGGYAWGIPVRLGHTLARPVPIEINTRMPGKVCARWGDGDGQNVCVGGESAAGADGFADE